MKRQTQVLLATVVLSLLVGALGIMIHDAYLGNSSTGDNGCASGDVVDGPVWLVVRLDSSAVPQPDGFRLGVLIGNARGEVAEAENVGGGTYRVALAPGK